MLGQKIASFIYKRILGWNYDIKTPDFDKYIICAAPHTSNWDFIIGKLFYKAIGRKTYFMMKSDWFFFPFGLVFRWMGGIPVNRGKRNSLVEQMVEKISQADKITLAITPEGTRSANPNWKKGFYYIAMNAGIPIALYGIDYKSKTIVSDKVIYPSGDLEKDMAEIKQYFTRFHGKHPENFAI